TCYHPLLLFNGDGDCLAAKLRPGNVHSAEGWEELLLPEIDRQQAQGKEVAFRGDAAFAKPEIYESVEEREAKYAIRLPANDNLERKVAQLLTARWEGRATSRWCATRAFSTRQRAGTGHGGGEGGVPLRGVVPASRLHRDQLPDFKPGGGALLQQAWHGG